MNFFKKTTLYIDLNVTFCNNEVTNLTPKDLEKVWKKTLKLKLQSSIIMMGIYDYYNGKLNWIYFQKFIPNQSFKPRGRSLKKSKTKLYNLKVYKFMSNFF